MVFFDWFSSLFRNSKFVSISGPIGEDVEEIINEIVVREMAFWTATNLIANVVSECKFRTYLNGAEVKDEEHYIWNVEPNRAQNASEFLHKLIATLYRENECLVVEFDGGLWIADSFDRKEMVMHDDKFGQIMIGDFEIKRSYEMSEVLYFKLNQTNMRNLIASIDAGYSKLLAYTMKSYQRSRGIKGIYNYDSLPPVKGDPGWDVYNDLINNRFRKFLQADGAILPLGMGQSFTELKERTYANETTRDIRALVDDITDFTANAFLVPPVLLSGKVQETETAMNQLLTLCIDPLVGMITKEINRKRYGMKAVAKGKYLQIDTKTVKHIDLLGVSEAIDKLISSGAFSINDIRKLVNEPEINEAWANEHYITRNYSSILDQKGGESG